MEVTVGAGARVSQVLQALKKKGLTLENFSSIQEQQMGGWTQVAAHGTGCALSTVEEQIVRMKLATPTNGMMVLSKENEPWLFKWAKVGLGSLGVVTELTLKVMPQLTLKETTSVISQSSVTNGHVERLCNFRHCRYMWIPHTDATVVVLSNPTNEKAVSTSKVYGANKKADKDTKPLSDLLISLQGEKCRKEAEAMSFSQLRDSLLDLDPLNPKHIRRINQSEALFWQNMGKKAVRIDDSTEILGFDCGGQQWVLEVCFPIGTLDDVGRDQRAAMDDGRGSSINAGSKDITFVRQLLDIINRENIAAPSPIEQRWTARSSSPMSPAYSPNPDMIFSWVGIIMYLPPGQSEAERREITRQFRKYTERMQPLMDEYGAKMHWAKIELPSPDDGDYNKRLSRLQEDLRKGYPTRDFMALKKALDPKGILSNKLVDKLFN
jgi:L-galactono-1,4-lactone dehydrogenase